MRAVSPQARRFALITLHIVICLLIVLVWIWSYWNWNEVKFSPTARLEVNLVADEGVVRLWVETFAPDYTSREFEAGRNLALKIAPNSRAGGNWAYNLRRFSLSFEANGAGGHVLEWVFPIWALLFATATLPIIWLQLRKLRRKRRKARGFEVTESAS